MLKRFQYFSLILTLFAALSLTGCTSALEMAFEDRSSDDIGTDTRIKTEILAEVTQALGAEIAAATSALVYEQTVLLSGKIDKASDKSKIVTITKNVSGVRKVINELTSSSGESSGVDDFLINQTIHAQSAANNFINHTNWRWNSVDGTVYLFGRSLTRQETSDMIRLVKDVDGVTKVINHAYIKAK